MMSILEFVVMSSWESRDLPVLQAVVELADEGERITPYAVAQRTGIDGKYVVISLRALAAESPSFFAYIPQVAGVPYDRVQPVQFRIAGPTGHARRTVGSWPSPRAMADQLVSEINKAADQEPDAEKQGWLRKTAGWLGGAGREVAVDVTAAVINRQITGGA